MKEVIETLLAEANIQINGSNPWDIQIHNPRFYRRITNNTELSLGESYMDGWWDCERLDEFFVRVLNANVDKKVLSHPKFWMNILFKKLYEKTRHFFNHQTKSRAFIVGEKHYDIGNEVYELMLDKRLVYTCAYWQDAYNLEEAQEAKLKLTCEKLQLKPGMRILDIGCGWGSFAKYAAEHYGVSVVGISVSKQQIKLAQHLCAGLPVEIRFQDYRDLINTHEKFDRLVSLGMFEHVGYKNYKTFMQSTASVLKDNGLFLLHTIGSNRSSVACNQWINTYIFPNGQIPSVAQIGQSLEKIFVMEDWHNFGVHYDKTLMHWHANFNQNWSSLQNKYDERFKRMWNFYLLSCAASFRARQNQLWQIALSKKGLPQGYARTFLATASEQQKTPRQVIFTDKLIN